MIANDKLLTVKEVAEFLRLSRSETYKLIQSKALPHYRVGPGRGAIRVKETDIQEFLEVRRLGPRKTPAPRLPIGELKHIKTKH